MSKQWGENPHNQDNLEHLLAKTLAENRHLIELVARTRDQKQRLLKASNSANSARQQLEEENDKLRQTIEELCAQAASRVQSLQHEVRLKKRECSRLREDKERLECRITEETSRAHWAESQLSILGRNHSSIRTPTRVPPAKEMMSKFLIDGMKGKGRVSTSNDRTSSSAREWPFSAPKVLASVSLQRGESRSRELRDSSASVSNGGRSCSTSRAHPSPSKPCPSYKGTLHEKKGGFLERQEVPARGGPLSPSRPPLGDAQSSAHRNFQRQHNHTHLDQDIHINHPSPQGRQHTRMPAAPPPTPPPPSATERADDHGFSLSQRRLPTTGSTPRPPPQPSPYSSNPPPVRRNFDMLYDPGEERLPESSTPARPKERSVGRSSVSPPRHHRGSSVQRPPPPAGDASSCGGGRASVTPGRRHEDKPPLYRSLPRASHTSVAPAGVAAATTFERASILGSPPRWASQPRNTPLDPSAAAPPPSPPNRRPPQGQPEPATTTIDTLSGAAHNVDAAGAVGARDALLSSPPRPRRERPTAGQQLEGGMAGVVCTPPRHTVASSSFSAVTPEGSRSESRKRTTREYEDQGAQPFSSSSLPSPGAASGRARGAPAEGVASLGGAGPRSDAFDFSAELTRCLSEAAPEWSSQGLVRQLAELEYSLKLKAAAKNFASVLPPRHSAAAGVSAPLRHALFFFTASASTSFSSSPRQHSGTSVAAEAGFDGGGIGSSIGGVAVAATAVCGLLGRCLAMHGALSSGHVVDLPTRTLLRHHARARQSTENQPQQETAALLRRSRGGVVVVHDAHLLVAQNAAAQLDDDTDAKREMLVAQLRDFMTTASDDGQGIPASASDGDSGMVVFLLDGNDQMGTFAQGRPDLVDLAEHVIQF